MTQKQRDDLDKITFGWLLVDYETNKKITDVDFNGGSVDNWVGPNRKIVTVDLEEHIIYVKDLEDWLEVA